MAKTKVTLRCVSEKFLRVELRRPKRGDRADLESTLGLYGFPVPTDRGFDMDVVAGGTAFGAASELARYLDADGFEAEVVL